MAVMAEALAAALPPGPDREGALAAVQSFQAAFDAMDPPRILACFAPGAIFLGTTMAAPTTDPSAILAYFQASAATALPKRLEIESALAAPLGPDTVLVAGQQRFFRTEAGGPASTPARYTLVLTRGAGAWRIAHFHSSRAPGA
jgi:uncharacterized protein (TIGR02246 family)